MGDVAPLQLLRILGFVQARKLPERRDLLFNRITSPELKTKHAPDLIGSPFCAYCAKTENTVVFILDSFAYQPPPSIPHVQASSNSIYSAPPTQLSSNDLL
jgi:hypothetical protein